MIPILSLAEKTSLRRQAEIAIYRLKPGTLVIFTSGDIILATIKSRRGKPWQET
jgi:hypothetical protein